MAKKRKTASKGRRPNRITDAELKRAGLTREEFKREGFTAQDVRERNAVADAFLARRAARSPEEVFQDRWINGREFTLAEAAKHLGFSSKAALWAAISRGTVPFSGEMVHGVETYLSGFDMIGIAAAQQLAELGVPRRIAVSSSLLIERRIAHVLTGNLREKVSIVAWPVKGDWEFATFSTDKQLDPESVPFAAVMLRVDELIAAEIEKIRALAALHESQRG